MDLPLRFGVVVPVLLFRCKHGLHVFRPSPHPHLRDDVLIGSTSGRYFSDVHSQFPHGRLYLNSVQQISRFPGHTGRRRRPPSTGRRLARHG
jgi:hypothetical protein